MGVFNNFKDLFLSVWEKGILGIDFFQIINWSWNIFYIPYFQRFNQ